MKQLSQRVAVVTGAGSGIGRALSVLLAQRGCRLALADIDQSGLDQTRELVTAKGAVASVHVVDVSNRERMQAFAAEVQSAHGGVQVLINNAGVSVGATFRDHTLEDFEWLMGINFWGVVYGCKFFLPALLASDEAHIVNLSSLFGLVGVPMQSSYCASKFAVRGFSESLRVELSGTRVGLTCVHPGGVATNIAARSRIHGDQATHARHAQIVKQFRRMLPPERAAEKIIAGIERGRSRVLITRETYLLDLAKRVFPVGANRLVQWSWQRAQH